MSTGNRRKTQATIALIGNAKVLFFDDISQSLDPQAKANLFNLIKEQVKSGSCVLLTTHSFEDAESLSHRVGFLMAGKLNSLGSVAHLKNKFHAAYELKLSFKFPTTESI